MISAVTVQAVCENGKLVVNQEVGGIVEAKNFVTGASFHQLAEHAASGEYQLLWEDDPAGNDTLIAACTLMEEIKRGVVEPGAPIADQPAEESTEEQVQTEFEHAEPVQAEEPKSEPKLEKVAEVPTSEILEIEVKPTPKEETLCRMVRDLEELKMELAGIQADYNKRIKDCMKQVFDYAKGVSKTHAKCNIVYDWEQGTRSWHVADTGEFVKMESIPDKMREVSLNLDAAMPEQPAEVPAVVTTSICSSCKKFVPDQNCTVESVELGENDIVINCSGFEAVEIYSAEDAQGEESLIESDSDVVPLEESLAISNSEFEQIDNSEELF
jgi:hypothetical protein